MADSKSTKNLSEMKVLTSWKESPRKIISLPFVAQMRENAS
jgi:hypothetical protein